MPIEHYIIDFLSAEWLVTNFFTVSIISLILYFSKSAKSKDQKIKIGIAIGLLLLCRAVLIHPYQIYVGKWNIIHSLPLHLCGVSAIISGILLIKFNQFLYEFLILLGIPGAVQALITPELTLGYDKVLLVEYFISHGGIVLSGLYLTLVLKNRPRLGAWKGVIIYPQVLLIFIHFINYNIGSNYMYTMTKPIAENPLIIGAHPYYYIGFEIIGILHILLFYYLFTRNREYAEKKELTTKVSYE